MQPSVLLDEEKRLNALRRSKLLDSASERMFDAIATRAAEICETPIALISLVDERRQWFKAKFGLEASETDREHAFCAHTILQDQLMVVPDACEDQRFAQNPLVTGEPNIRFYAGMPLITSDGAAFGSLCVIDQKPRDLTPGQTAQLKVLAESARILLEMRASPMGEIFERALAATVEGFTVADAREPDLPIIFANEAFYKITGYAEQEVIGRNCRFLQGEGTDCDALQKVRESLAAKKTCVVEILNYTKAGRSFWNRLSIIPLVDEQDELTYVVGLQADITEMKEAEAARQQLLGVTTTMNTVNDIVFNFMNNLQLYRMEMEDTWNVEAGILQEFDAVFDDTRKKLLEINTLTAFKSKMVVEGIAVLDTD